MWPVSVPVIVAERRYNAYLTQRFRVGMQAVDRLGKQASVLDGVTEDEVASSVVADLVGSALDSVGEGHGVRYLVSLTA